MNKSDIFKYINDPGLLNDKTSLEIKQIKDEYPYFHSAYLLTVKNFQISNNPDFETLLHLSAAYVTDRSILYDLLHRDIKTNIQKPAVSDKKPTIRQIKENLRDNISDILSSQLNDVNGKDHGELELMPDIAIDVIKEYGRDIKLDDHIFTLNTDKEGEVSEEVREQEPRLLQGKEPKIVESGEVNTSNELLLIEDNPDEAGKSFINSQSMTEEDENLLHSKEIDIITTEEDVIEIEFEAEQDKVGKLTENKTDDKQAASDVTDKEEHSFTDWLKVIDNRKEKEQDEVVGKPVDEKKKLSDNELIEKFIYGNPGKIVPQENPENHDISEESVKEHEGYITDTLAKIYIKQGYFTKAILAYEKLILKYPEKSSYFAAQIKEIKKIIKNL